MRRLAVALAVLALGAAAPAAADVAVRAVDLEEFPTVRLTVVAPGPPAVTEDGRPAAGLVRQNLGDATSVALVVDRSRSMAGAPLADALAAVRAYLAANGRGDRVAIFAAGSRAVQLTGFSPGAADARAALRGVAVDRTEGTALHDAVALASGALAEEPPGARVAIVVTDGRDVRSGTSLESAIAAARAAGVAVYAVGLPGAGFAPGPLRALAGATGGRYEAAPSSARLAGMYAALARELERTWRLEYVTRARPGDRLRARVAVPGGGEAVVERMVGRSLGPASVAAFGAPARGPWLDRAVALAVAALVFLAVSLVARYRRARALRGRIAAWPDEPVAAGALRDRLPRGDRLFRATEGALGRLRPWRAVERSLVRADVPLRAAELVYGTAALGLAAVAVAASVGASPPAVLAAGAVGLLLPYGVVAAKARRRAAAIDAQLPDVLLTLAASLKAGHSFHQALHAVSDTGDGPLAKELRLVLAKARLGRPLGDGLAEMASRLGSENLDFVVSTVAIQSQVGGSLAGLFELVAETVRQREQLERKVGSLTAMGRLSAYVLVALPIVLAALLTALNPAYMSPLYETATGQRMIAGSLAMMAFGGFVLKRIVAVKS